MTNPAAVTADAQLIAEELRVLTARMTEAERLQVYRAAARLLAGDDPGPD